MDVPVLITIAKQKSSITKTSNTGVKPTTYELLGLERVTLSMTRVESFLDCDSVTCVESILKNNENDSSQVESLKM